MAKRSQQLKSDEEIPGEYMRTSVHSCPNYMNRKLKDDGAIAENNGGSSEQGNATDVIWKNYSRNEVFHSNET